MINTILVQRLIDMYDPFEGLYIYVPKGKDLLDMVLSAAPEPNFIPDLGKRSRKYHYGRLRFFYEMYLSGQEDKPIEIDNYCPNGYILPVPVLVDGHHRLIGAIMAGKEKIKCSYSGRLDLLRYLQGRRKTIPQE